MNFIRICQWFCEAVSISDHFLLYCHDVGLNVFCHIVTDLSLFWYTIQIPPNVVNKIIKSLY